MNINVLAGGVISLGWPLIFMTSMGYAHDVTGGACLAIMVARFLCHCRLSISNVSFSVLTKHWVPIFLSKLSENSALLGKWIKYIC